VSEISTAKPFLHFPLLPTHPRLRFIDGAPDAPADPPAEPAEDPADPEDPPTDPDPSATDDEELGDAGKKALDAWKARAKAAEAAKKAAETELAKSKAAIPDPDKVRDEAREAATKVANERVQRAELKAAAKGRLVDPTEALLNIDPTQFTVDENGDIDSDALNQAITALLEKKPYLAAPSNPFKGGGDGGATPPPKPADSVDQLAAQALASGDTRGSIALKLSTLTPPTP
jgi:hypothetical protein